MFFLRQSLRQLRIALLVLLVGNSRKVVSESTGNDTPIRPTQLDADYVSDRTDSGRIGTHDEPNETTLPKAIAKRSIDNLDSFQQSNAYDLPYTWIDNYNPGYSNFLPNVGYDPFSIWNKRSAPVDRRTMQKTIVGVLPNLPGVPSRRPVPFISLVRRPVFVSRMQFNRNEDMPYQANEYDYVGDDVMPQKYLRQFKRSIIPYDSLYSYDGKRTPSEMGARGFHEGIFTHGFGDFSPVKRGKREVGGNRVSGEESTTHRQDQLHDALRRYLKSKNLSRNPLYVNGFLPYQKRKPEWNSNGFHGDAFTGGFGDFYTMRKRKPEMDSSGFYGDTFNGGFGDFYTMKRPSLKRMPEMTSSGFHGDTFSGGFGDFYTMKRDADNSRLLTKDKRNAMTLNTADKRNPEMTSSGFHGDTFSGGFGDFYTMKRDHLQKRRPEMTSSGFHGDTFNSGFGDFYTMKRNEKRRPEMTSSGFHGDTFTNGFGDFYTMKRDYQKRQPEMTSSGFHGDTFTNGFGDFYTMKRNIDGDRETALLSKLANDSDDKVTKEVGQLENGAPDVNNIIANRKR